MIKNYVTYKEFGALGDGKADDMPAIVACHEYANRHDLSVVADEGEYYIGGRALTAVIMTDTDFGNARFIIDDRNLESINQSCFKVSTKAERFTPEIASLEHNQKKIEFPYKGNYYVRVFSDKKVYIRKGLNKNNGTDASDCFIVDESGNIKCGINWNHGNITKAYAFSVDDKPITVQGGYFTTVSNQSESKYNYHSRNIDISRSNVTVQNLTHFVTGEACHGAPYSGFITVSECAGVTIRNCRLTPHKTYFTESQIPGEMVSMGSYDLNCTAVIGLRLENITQSVDILDTRYWGLMGSNFCKNVSLSDCIMSRFDAHCGVTGCKIINCTFGHMGINIIGFGDFLIQNTTVINRHFVNFRDDYGANFNGRLTIRNCVWKPFGDKHNSYCVFRAENTGDHDFGYPCIMAESIDIDGLLIDDDEIADFPDIVMFCDYDSNFSFEKPYPYGTPNMVRAKVYTKTGRKITAFKNEQLYKNTKLIMANVL